MTAAAAAAAAPRRDDKTLLDPPRHEAAPAIAADEPTAKVDAAPASVPAITSFAPVAMPATDDRVTLESFSASTLKELEHTDRPIEVHEEPPRNRLEATVARARPQRAMKVAIAACAALALVAVGTMRITGASRGAARGGSSSVEATSPGKAGIPAVTVEGSPGGHADGEDHGMEIAVGRDPEEARREVLEARAALEKWKTTEGTEAAERATLLDPANAEAWLVLGAAQELGGDLASARKSYHACAERGDPNRRKECADLLAR